MKESYLEVTFRHGRPLAAYLYLPRASGEKSVRTSKAEPGMVVDFGRSGRPIGIELTAPTKVTLSALNRVLDELGQPLLRDIDLEPLRARRRAARAHKRQELPVAARLQLIRPPLGGPEA